MNKADWRILAGLAVIGLVRLVAAGLLPLSADEAYYWLWSQHLAAGYFDHPPAIAWLIRAGTLPFGDTAFGVRVGGILLSFAATWFVWRAAAILCRDNSHRSGAVAALLFNITLMVGVETLAATPDAPSIFFAAIFFWALAEFTRKQDGRWWLVAGAAAGLGLLSKYTALFLGAGALIWLIASPPMRRHLRSPWPYLGAVLAFALFAPNIWWNAQHHWGTFAFQFGRASRGELSGQFIFEFLGSQLVLATPFLLILGGFGFAAAMKQRSEAVYLIAALIWPALLYFLVHSLHERVQGNWPCFLYPVLAVAATGALQQTGPDRGKVRHISGMLAVPVAAMMLIATYIQALMGIFPLGPKDPLARLLAVGMPEVVQKIGALQKQEKAAAILTTDYTTAAWLSFYMPKSTRIAVMGQDERFPDATPMPAALAGRPLLYVCEDRRARHWTIAAHYARISELARIDRMRAGQSVSRYIVFQVGWPYIAPYGRMVR